MIFIFIMTDVMYCYWFYVDERSVRGNMTLQIIVTVRGMPKQVLQEHPSPPLHSPSPSTSTSPSTSPSSPSPPPPHPFLFFGPGCDDELCSPSNAQVISTSDAVLLGGWYLVDEPEAYRGYVG